MKNSIQFLIAPLSMVFFLAIAGCATPTRPMVPVPTPGPTRAPESWPREASEQSGAAVLALLEQADVEMRAGANSRAVAKLENALRIESRNPFVWQRLASANLLEGRLEQAESLAMRSISLARGNPWLGLVNWRVIAEARRSRGDAAGAEAAEEKVTALEEQLDR